MSLDFAGTVTAINQAGPFEDLSPLIKPFGYREKILLARLADGPAATFTLHEWSEDDLKVDVIAQVGGAMTTSNTTFSPNSTADMSRYSVGEHIQIDKEVLRVTAIGTSTVTVARGIGGTTATDHSTTASVLLLGRAAIDGAAALTAVSTLKVVKSNYIQTFEDPLKVSDLGRGIKRPGGSELSYQKMKKMIEHLKNIDKTIIYGAKQVGTGSVPATMGGIYEFLTTTNTIQAQSTDSITATLTFRAFESTLATLHGNGAEPDLCVPNAVGIKALDEWITNAYRTQKVGNQGYGADIQEIKTGFGDVGVVYSKHLTSEWHGKLKARGVMLILDRSRLKVSWFQGDGYSGKTHYQDLYRDGHAMRGMITSDLTLERWNAPAHAAIYGFHVGT